MYRRGGFFSRDLRRGNRCGLFLLAVSWLTSRFGDFVFGTGKNRGGRFGGGRWRCRRGRNLVVESEVQRRLVARLELWLGLQVRRHGEDLSVARDRFGGCLMLRTGFGLRCRRCKCSGTARFGKQRVSWIELASERHSFLPGLTLPAGYRIQLACDGFECRWLIVLGVDLQQLEINF